MSRYYQVINNIYYQVYGLNKEYSPFGGEGDFFQKATKLAFGEISNEPTEDRNVTIQGISITGFLTIGAELMSKLGGTRPSMYHGKPHTHTPIFKFAGSWLRYFIEEGHNQDECYTMKI